MAAKRSTKDKEMAAALRRNPQMRERWSGRCPLCGKIIKNVAMVGHISAHSRGVGDN